jgi:hypothetical protein
LIEIFVFLFSRESIQWQGWQLATTDSDRKVSIYDEELCGMAVDFSAKEAVRYAGEEDIPYECNFIFFLLI